MKTRSMMPSPLRAFAAVILVAIAATAAATPAEVGMIVDYSPARGSHTIRHADGTTTPVKLGTLVVAGDVLLIDAGGHVFVQLNDGTQHDVGPGEWRVPDSKPLGPIASLLRSLPRLLDVQATIAASASTRSGESCDATDPNVSIEAPILRSHSKVVIGTQNLALGWFGGCPPFAIELAKADRIIGAAQGLTRRQHQFIDLDLTAGVYRLRIADAAGRQRSYDIEAVAATPAPPAGLASTDSATADIARALWLADLDGGTWRLESFKTLHPLMAQKERIATLIGDYLLVSAESVAPTATP